MKKTKSIALLLVIVMAMCAVCFAGCDDGIQTIMICDGLSLPEMGEKDMAIVEKIDTNMYECYVVTLTGELSEDSTLDEVFQYLHDNRDVDYALTQYTFLDRFGRLSNDYENSTYIMLYTSVESDFDNSAYAVEYIVDGVTTCTSCVGCKEMHVKYGAVIYIQTIVC